MWKKVITARVNQGSRILDFRFRTLLPLATLYLALTLLVLGAMSVIVFVGHSGWIHCVCFDIGAKRVKLRLMWSTLPLQ